MNNPIKITSDVDEPFATDDCNQIKLSKAEVNELESISNVYVRLHGVKLKNHALKLIVICLAIMIVFYFCDVLFTHLGIKNSSLLTSIFELLKFLVSSLVGFVFASKSERL